MIGITNNNVDGLCWETDFILQSRAFFTFQLRRWSTTSLFSFPLQKNTFFTATSLTWQWQLSSCKLDAPTLIIAHLQWLESASLPLEQLLNVCNVIYTAVSQIAASAKCVRKKKKREEKKNKETFDTASRAKG